MATQTKITLNNGLKNRTSRPSGLPKVILIEENPLTAWSIQETLCATHDVVCFSTLEAAKSELESAGVEFVICGGPLSDDHPDQVQKLASLKGLQVVALVSDPDSSLLAPVEVLEKPFELSRLTDIVARQEGGSIMESLEARLQRRFEKEVCSVCVNQTAGGGCSLGNRQECPVFKWVPALADLIEHMASNRLGDYQDRIQAIICPGCKQDAQGVCKARDHLDCPLDLYLGLVVPIVEDEIKRMKKKAV